VVVRLDVDSEGRTRNVRVIDSQPRGPFDGAARATVRSWRFEPPGEEGLERCVVVLDYRLGVGRIGL
jgi:TonB family protein